MVFWKVQVDVIDWFEKLFDIFFKDENSFYCWYKGGKLNIFYLVLDYYVVNGWGDQFVIFYDFLVMDIKEIIIYVQLLDCVARFVGVFKVQGVEKGDIVIIYMFMILQIVVVMLACVRLGVIYFVVFGGFVVYELVICINDVKFKFIFIVSVGKEINWVIDYMKIVNLVLDEVEYQVQGVIVYQWDILQALFKDGWDFDWDVLLVDVELVDCVLVESMDLLYILYIFGIIGKFKGIVCDNGGYVVVMKFSMKYIYGVELGEVYWAVFDVGWVVGYFYIVYVLFIYGCIMVLYEGKFVCMFDVGVFWCVLEEYGVSVFFIVFIVFWAIKKEDFEVKFKVQYDMSKFCYFFLVGECCDVFILEWCQDVLQVFVIDYWWQIELGWLMFVNMVGVEFLFVKLGLVGKLVCGYDFKVVGFDGELVLLNIEGVVVICLFLVFGILFNFWQDIVCFIDFYFSFYFGYYFIGDGGYIDEDGYVFIIGCIDDIINVAGYCFFIVEMEEVVVVYLLVVECVVIGVYDDFKG